MTLHIRTYQWQDRTLSDPGLNATSYGSMRRNRNPQHLNGSRERHAARRDARSAGFNSLLRCDTSFTVCSIEKILPPSQFDPWWPTGLFSPIDFVPVVFCHDGGTFSDYFEQG